MIRPWDRAWCSVRCTSLAAVLAVVATESDTMASATHFDGGTVNGNHLATVSFRRIP